jgi:hypothetical protein
MPEPFSVGILLTFVALMLAWTSTPATAEDVLVAWGGGLMARRVEAASRSMANRGERQSILSGYCRAGTTTQGS